MIDFGWIKTILEQVLKINTKSICPVRIKKLNTWPYTNKHHVPLAFLYFSSVANAQLANGTSHVLHVFPVLLQNDQQREMQSKQMMDEWITAIQTGDLEREVKYRFHNDIHGGEYFDILKLP